MTEVLLRVTVLLFATALVALALRRSSAALLHLVWTMSLVGTLLIPLCWWALPGWQWAVLPRRPPTFSPAESISPAPSSASVVDDVVSPIRLHAEHSLHPLAAHSPHSAASMEPPIEIPASPPAPAAENRPATPTAQPAWSWSDLLAAAWALGTCLGLLWIGIGVTAAWHVARRAKTAADPCWREISQQLVGPCGIRRPVEVRECPQISVPMTWGLRRPVILVPEGSAAWPEPIKRSVLLHELGHVRRGDCLMLLLGRLACAAYWFHPLAWLAARQLRKTSEQAADDLVLASHVAPPDYAEHLVGIAAQIRGLPMFGHVALPMASPSDLESRVRAILDPQRNHRGLKRKTCYAMMTLAVLLVIPCAILRLGHAEEKMPPEPAAASKDMPADGQPAAEKQPVAQPDDRAARPELAVAEAKYNLAKSKAEDDIDVRYVVAAAAVAKAEYEVNQKANKTVPDSVPPQRLNELSLKCIECDLAIARARVEQRIASEQAKIAKAEFEAAKLPGDRKIQREMDVAKAEAKYRVEQRRADDDIDVRYAKAAAQVAKAEYDINKRVDDKIPGSVPKVRLDQLSLKCKETELAIAKAEHERRIAGEKAKVAKAEVEAAKRQSADEQPAPTAPKGKVESGPAKAGTTSTEPAEQPPALLTAFGKVLDPAGKPVARAKVYLREWSTYRISMEWRNKTPNDILATRETDAQGAFRFENVPAKPLHDEWLKKTPWDVVVVAKPYAMAWRHLRSAQQSKPLTITLAPEAKISGRVTDQQGRPVRNAEVEIDAIDSLGSRRDLPSKDSHRLDLQGSRLAPKARTDADGKMTMEGLPSELLLAVDIKHDIYPTKYIHVATADQPQPDFGDPEYGANGEKIRSEEVYCADFVTTLEDPLPRIVGRVMAADNKGPLPNVTVSPQHRIGTKTDQDGRFILRDIGESQCRVFVVAPKSSGDFLARSLVVKLPKGKSEVPLEVELERGGSLSGIVADAETGKGVAGVWVSFDNGLDTNKMTIDWPLANSTVTDRAGGFRLVVPPGKGKVRIIGPVRGYDPPSSGDLTKDFKEDVAGFFKEVDVIAGKPNAELMFTIHRGNPTIGPEHAIMTVEGRVVDLNGKPVAGAEVGLNRWFQGIGWQIPVPTDRDGHFSFQVLPSPMRPNELIVAIQKERKLRGQAPMANISKMGSATRAMEIHLGPTGIVTGRVQEGDEPIIGAQVSLIESAQGRGRPRSTMDRTETNEDGRFEFPLVEAGKKFEVIACIEGDYVATGGSGEVAAGRTVEVKPFSLARSGESVAGKVVDPEGNPVAGVLVRAALESGLSISYAVALQPTGKDGKFTIGGLPNVGMLTLAAFLPITKDSKDRKISNSAHVKAVPGEMDVRIVFNPKLARGKK